MAVSATRFHPVASIFPPMTEGELSALVADIRQNGLRDAIWLHRNGQIIDGRNRYLACCEAGIEPRYQTWGGADSELVAFVVSLNLHRRHLDESQRAMVAAKVATLDKGNPANAPIGAIAQGVAAGLLNVSRRSVQRARKVVEHAAPELKDAVERGEVSVSAAATIADLPQQTQAAVVQAGPAEVRRVARTAGASSDPLDTRTPVSEVTDQEAQDAACLRLLKRTWKSASRRVRTEFRRWMDESQRRNDHAETGQ